MINARRAKNLTEQNRRDSYKDVLDDIDKFIKFNAENGEYSARYNYPKKINDLEVTPTVKMRVEMLLKDNGYRIDTSTGDLNEKDTKNGYIDISWRRPLL